MCSVKIPLQFEIKRIRPIMPLIIKIFKCKIILISRAFHIYKYINLHSCQHHMVHTEIVHVWSVGADAALMVVCVWSVGADTALMVVICDHSPIRWKYYGVRGC